MFDEINIDFDELSNDGIKDILTIVKKQNDTRYQPNVKHKIEDIILMTLFAVLAKCNEWTEIESFAKKKEKWLKKYLEQGEVGLENKKKPGNPLSKYMNKKQLSDIEKLEYENMKLRIENERLKKGYIVEGDGQVVIFNGSKNKNSK